MCVGMERGGLIKEVFEVVKDEEFCGWGDCRAG
jgi:hypothetical protein